jgi:SAM-dependent methyltransferase
VASSPADTGLNLVYKPFAESADQNKDPILEVLGDWFRAPGRVLEIGSGTGQHAVHFARGLPDIVWQPSDVAEHLEGIEVWRLDSELANLLPALMLDVAGVWPQALFDYVFTANTAHIMHWPEVQAMLAGVGRVLRAGGLFAMYGPFAVNGEHTAPSNAAFDLALKRVDPGMGVRDMADLCRESEGHGLVLDTVVPMPVDNLILIFKKSL